MNAEERNARYRQIKDISGRALELEGDERLALVRAECGEDDDLRQEVESLLAADDTMGDEFIAEPLIPRYDEMELSEERRHVGPYRLLERLGAGGMGVVFLAERQVEFEHKVALKLIMRGLENDEIVHRFRYERQILANLQHPNIARLLDGGTTDDGLPYFVMEYVEGEPISAYCKARDVSTTQRLELFRQVCEAVAFAHRNLVVHRDIKPANILVTADGIPKLLDFGIAKLLNSEGGDPKTRLLRPLTTEYASPEQLAYQNVTTASDIYTLGVLLYELLAGRRPYPEEESNPQTLLEATRDHQPPPPSQVALAGSDVRRLSADLDAIVLKALRAEPEERYPSVEQLIDDLERHRVGLPVLARRGSAAYRFSKFVRRHRARLVIGLISVGLLISLGFGLLKQRDAKREYQEKLQEEALAEAFGDFLMQVFEEGNPDEGDAVSQERYDASGEILVKAAQASEELLRDKPLPQAAILGALGRIHGRRGEFDQALEALAQSEAIRREVLGDSHPDLSMVLNNQANVMRSTGDYRGAKAKLEEGLRVIRLAEEPDIKKIHIALNNLAGVEKALGNSAAAVELFTEALAIKQRALDGAAPNLSAVKRADLAVDLALGHNNLGSALLQQGNFAAAAEQFRRGLELLGPIEGRDRRRASILKNYGALRRAEGEWQSATWMLQESLEIRQRFYQPGSRRIADVEQELALLEQAQGEHLLAVDRLRRVVQVREQTYGEEHPEVGRSLAYLGYSLQQMGDAGAAQTLARAHTMLLQFLGASHPEVVRLQGWLQQAAPE